MDYSMISASVRKPVDYDKANPKPGDITWALIDQALDTTHFDEGMEKIARTREIELAESTDSLNTKITTPFRNLSSKLAQNCRAAWCKLRQNNYINNIFASKKGPSSCLEKAVSTPLCPCLDLTDDDKAHLEKLLRKGLPPMGSGVGSWTSYFMSLQHHCVHEYGSERIEIRQIAEIFNDKFRLSTFYTITGGASDISVSCCPHRTVQSQLTNMLDIQSNPGHSLNKLHNFPCKDCGTQVYGSDEPRQRGDLPYFYFYTTSQIAVYDKIICNE
ncbi:hypothetical protein AWENTII_006773 [Aspergillus wentii]